jgi:peptidyl-prolyl cis-trans isomerase A (cyclophilin A)
MIRKLTALAALASLILLAPSLAVGDEPGDPSTPGDPILTEAAASGPNPALLDPALADEKAPDAFRVKLETSKGDVLILVNRQWAPNGADRFYNLVKIGYFDGVVFYRVIAGFMAQCGFNPDPKVSAAWSAARIPDDPVTRENTRGMVTFAQPSQPNARSSQIFINFGDNAYLKKHGAFAPFGKVISGMDVVDSLFSGYGEGAPSGRGPSQSMIAREGNEYLKRDFPKLDFIIRATIVE